MRNFFTNATYNPSGTIASVGLNSPKADNPLKYILDYLADRQKPKPLRKERPQYLWRPDLMVSDNRERRGTGAKQAIAKLNHVFHQLRLDFCQYGDATNEHNIGEFLSVVRDYNSLVELQDPDSAIVVRTWLGNQISTEGMTDKQAQSVAADLFQNTLFIDSRSDKVVAAIMELAENRSAARV